MNEHLTTCLIKILINFHETNSHLPLPGKGCVDKVIYFQIKSSENILYGCLAAREKKFSKVITLSGMGADNLLRKMGDINLWADSKAYNYIENIHQFWLLAVVDLIIGKTEYSAKPYES